MTQVTSLDERIAEARDYKDYFDFLVECTAENPNATYEDYKGIVDEVYSIPGFLDLQPLPIADMTGLQEDEEKEKEWLRIRKHGPNGDIPHIVGGSSVASIIGISPWVSPLMVKAKMREEALKKAPEENTDAFKRGHDAEPYIAGLITRFEGFRNVEVIEDATFYQHPVFSFMAGNIDRFLKFQDGTMGVGEIKTTSAMMGNRDVIEKWQRGEIPPYYQTQAVWYMAIMNMMTTDFFCGWGLSQKDEMATAHLDRNIELEKEMIAYVLFFIEEVVKKNKMPNLRKAKGKLLIDDLYALTGDVFLSNLSSQSTSKELAEQVKTLGKLQENFKEEEKSWQEHKKELEDEIAKAQAEILLEVQGLLEKEAVDLGFDADQVQAGGVEVELDGKKAQVWYKSSQSKRFSIKVLEKAMVESGKGEEFAELKELGSNTTTSKSLRVGKWK